MRNSRYPLIVSLLALVVSFGIAPSARAQQTPTPDPVFVGAGDIAQCELKGAAETAKLIEGIEGTVFTAGDNVYQRGTAAEFRKCYEPTWGKFKDRTYPALGNHDVLTDNAAPYFAYFGDKAGPAGKGYY